MPLIASTESVLGRCWQHRPSACPVLAHTGMFIGLWPRQQHWISVRRASELKLRRGYECSMSNSPTGMDIRSNSQNQSECLTCLAVRYWTWKFKVELSDQSESLFEHSDWSECLFRLVWLFIQTGLNVWSNIQTGLNVYSDWSECLLRLVGMFDRTFSPMSLGVFYSSSYILLICDKKMILIHNSR